MTTGGTKIVHDKVDSTSGTTNVGVERTRPKLSVGSELVTNLEESYVLVHSIERDPGRTYAVCGEEHTLQVWER